ncbi:MAG: type II toxin-antitoxin system RelE/ParE family toxin [Thermoanaerobacteraceae bacterium]|nr:type II toxin-antitoxin system RelE/ParE family toxin [Thermoanaerobacteraceae bacterium]
MQKYSVEILPPAWIELDEIAEYHLHTVGINSAKKVTDNIISALERLKQYPLSCPYVPDEELRMQEYRMLVCDKYVCFYKLIGNTVYVYHIVHGSKEYSALFKTK